VSGDADPKRRMPFGPYARLAKAKGEEAKMRKLIALPLLAVALTGVAAVPASGQEEQDVEFTSKFSMTPERAGTKARPKGVHLDARLSVNVPDGMAGIFGGRILLPKGTVYNGALYPRCSAAVLRMDGAGRPPFEVCSVESIMGASTTLADADGVLTRPKLMYVNGGAREILALITLFHPAFVQEPMEIDVRKLHGRKRKWAYDLRFVVPDNIRIVAGVPILLPELDIDLGGKPYAPRYLVTNGGCPERGFLPYRARVHYELRDGATGTSAHGGRIACR
jgi:hypothetical protein